MMFDKHLVIIATFVILILNGMPLYAGKPIMTEQKTGHFEFVGFTDDVLGTVDGAVGFDGMHAECQADFGPDARFCTSKEYLLTPGHVAPNTPAWVHPITDFVRNLAHAQHSCSLWTSNSAIERAAIVNTDATITSEVDDGDSHCDAFRPVTCCAPIN